MNEQKVPTVGDWMVILLIMSIPLVNFIALIYWAVSSTSGPVKSNFAKAALVWLAIIIALSFLFLGALVGAIVGLSK